MARRSPEPPQPPADSVSSVEAPSAAAELHIMMVPSGDSPDKVPGRQEIQAAGNPVSRLVTRARRAGLDVRAGMTVPAANAGEMLSLCNNLIWGLTVVLTLAITVPARVPDSVVVEIIAIELAGFVSALLLRRKRQPR